MLASHSAIDGFGGRASAGSGIPYPLARRRGWRTRWKRSLAPSCSEVLPTLCQPITGHPERSNSVRLYLYVSHCANSVSGGVMIATDDFLYEVHRNPPQWPAMVREREPTGIRPATKGASRDGISAPADFGANNDGGASPDAISAPAAPAVSEGNGVSRDAISTPSRSGPGTDDIPCGVRHPRRALPGHGPLRRGDSRGRRRTRALGSGRDPRFRGNVAAHGVRCGGGRHGPCEGRGGPERGPTDTHHPAPHPAGAGGARPGMPIPGMRLPLHRGPSRETLGRRRKDEPEEHAAPMPTAPPRRSREAGEGFGEQRWDGAVLHAEGKNAGGCAEATSACGCDGAASAGEFGGTALRSRPAIRPVVTS